MKISCIIVLKRECEFKKTCLAVTISQSCGLVKNVTIIISTYQMYAGNVVETNTTKKNTRRKILKRSLRYGTGNVISATIPINT